MSAKQHPAFLRLEELMARLKDPFSHRHIQRKSTQEQEGLQSENWKSSPTLSHFLD